MVYLSRIYTRSGDQGQTALGNGQRVSKHHLRVEAYGTVDEANALLGVVLGHCADADRHAMLTRIQNDLFDAGADLCTPRAPDEAEGARLRMTPAQTTRLEAEIDAMNEQLSPLNSFILPGGTPEAASLHLARTVVRRAERLCCALAEMETITPAVITYLNRLSDHLFVMARIANAGQDVLWVAGNNR